MSGIRERIKEVIDTHESHRKFKAMEEKCGFSSTAWRNVYHGNQKANEEHLEAMFKAFPQYACWLATGKTREDVGDTSPILDRIQNDLRKAGRDAA